MTSVPDNGALLTVAGIHHVRVPVSDVMASRDWYTDTLGFRTILITESEEAVTGVVMGHAGGVVLVLQHAPERAAVLAGFAVIALAVTDLSPWPDYLDGLGVAHSGIVDGHLGQCLHLSDPDGILVELHTLAQPSAGAA